MLKVMKRLGAWCGMLLVSASALGQTLEECRRLAVAHYPEVKRYDLIGQTEYFTLANVSRRWLPQVQVLGQGSWQSAAPEYPEAFRAMMSAQGIHAVGVKREQYRVGVDVSQIIWDGGALRTSRAMAAADAEEQRRQTDVALYEFQSRVDNVYFGLLLLHERIAQQRSLIVLLEQTLGRMRSYCVNGVAMQADVDLIEAEMLAAEQVMGQLEALCSSYRGMLEMMIGQPLASGTPVRPSMCDVQSGECLRPELRLLDAQQRRLDVGRKAIRASLMPKFSAFAQGYYGYPGLDMFESMTSRKGSLNALLGVRMTWNLGAFYTRRNDVEKLNLRQREIEVKRDVFLFNTRLRILQEDGEIARLRKAVENDERIVQLRRSVRVSAESQLGNGVIDATDLLRKITDETTAVQNQSIHELELLQAIYKLKTTLNQ